MTTLVDLSPALRKLADQADSAAPPTLPEGPDAVPEFQRAAWLRVLVGCVNGEGLEEWAIGPMLEGLAHAGVADEGVVAFFRTQGADELRHRDMFAAYAREHFGQAGQAATTAAHQVMYQGVFQNIIRQSARHPLRLLMPLLFYERAAGSMYMTRLIDCVPPSMPRLAALLKSVRQDEARHVAGVGLTCRALVRLQRPDWAERRLLEGICRLVYLDMDRTAWWKPELGRHMNAIGLDTEAMARDNARVLAEMLALVEGRG